MNSEKVCLVTDKYIMDTSRYLMPIIPYDYFEQYFGDRGKIKSYIQLAQRIEHNINIHDTLTRIDGTHESINFMSFKAVEAMPKYTSITEKFKDWKHLTLLVDKTIDEIKDLIRITTKYTNKKDFMNGPQSLFKITGDIAQMKKELCVVNKRGELNMSLKYEGGKYTRNVRRSKKRPSKTRHRSRLNLSLI